MSSFFFEGAGGGSLKSTCCLLFFSWGGGSFFSWGERSLKSTSFCFLFMGGLPENGPTPRLAEETTQGVGLQVFAALDSDETQQTAAQQLEQKDGFLLPGSFLPPPAGGFENVVCLLSLVPNGALFSFFWGCPFFPVAAGHLSYCIGGFPFGFYHVPRSHRRTPVKLPFTGRVKEHIQRGVPSL